MRISKTLLKQIIVEEMGKMGKGERVDEVMEEPEVGDEKRPLEKGQKWKQAKDAPSQMVVKILSVKPPAKQDDGWVKFGQVESLGREEDGYSIITWEIEHFRRVYPVYVGMVKPTTWF